MFRFRSKLAEFGILGNNRRIAQFILPHNKRSDYPLVDDKILTSALLLKAGLPAPEALFTIASPSDMRTLHARVKDYSDFVVKPARGAMGNGIIVILETKWSESKDETLFETARRNQLDYHAFAYHFSTILSGLYSLNGQTDRALVQQRLQVHPDLERISYRGVPDVRVIVFKGYPVMAMVRLPTQNSGGRGNLHQGAVGCGIDLRTGEITSAISRNLIIDKHPDYGVTLRGIRVPAWRDTLLLAIRCSDLVQIGYLGVDIVIGPTGGPKILEMNARPGLSIQLANRKGLLPSLQQIEALPTKRGTPEERLEYCLNELP